MSIPTQEGLALAMNHNFTVTISPKRGTSLQRGSRHIWEVQEGWQTADLVDGDPEYGEGEFMVNHKKFATLSEAIKRERP